MNSIKPIEQPTYRLKPLSRMDKHENREDRRRRDNRSFAAIYKAQTGKVERRFHVVIILLVLANVVNQTGILKGWW